jgi:hypothetical protein
MRNFKIGLATLATTAAVLVPAGLASADGALIKVCDSHGACSPYTDVDVQNVNVCGISVVDIAAILAGTKQSATCSNGKTASKW